MACGLCIPGCPTYRKTGSEADSPRGRVALMEGFLAGRLPATGRFFRHLDLCLTCRACERACPNHVAYGRLVDGVRERVFSAREESRSRRVMREFLLGQAIEKPARLGALAPLLRLYTKDGIRGLARRSGLLRLMGLADKEAQLPARIAAAPKPAIYPAQGKERGSVGLFLGCVARLLDGETLAASAFVLNRLGYTVHVPERQTCCGGLHQDLGLGADARRLAMENAEAFSGARVEAVVATASGCGARLADYRGDPATEAFAGRVRDICVFLLEAEGWASVPVAALPERVLVHDSCTLRNVLRGEQAAYRLLERIPEARIEALGGNDQCCGAAGSYFLREPQMARALRDDKIAAVRGHAARYLATSNVGCARFIASGLKTVAPTIEVAHPVTILARQMGFRC